MYYLVVGREKGTRDEDLFFKLKTKANSKEEAIENAKKGMEENEEIVEVKELTIEDCIKMEMRSIEYEVKHQYLVNHYDIDNMAVGKSCKVIKNYDEDRENYYLALQEVNVNLRELRGLFRCVNVDNMRVSDLRDYIKQLKTITTEDEYNKFMDSLKEKYGDKYDRKKDKLTLLEIEYFSLLNSNCDRQPCLVLDANTVYLTETKETYKLTDYFKSIKSLFDPTYYMCYTTPGEVTTIQEIHLHCLECEIRHLLAEKLVNNTVTEGDKRFFKSYLPDLYDISQTNMGGDK